MTVDLFIRGGIALTAVVLLLVICMGLSSFIQKQRDKKGYHYLKVIETLALDPKHRLVLIQCGARVHLLLLGGATNLVVDRFEKSSATKENSYYAEPHL
ncbi:MAG: flagellar biosynthetic protein FliO [Holosporales bacterium]|jgi:flagellar biogenesis protein FliO|nr:flagellar biosynthetic protein FliO [Holosporales bacterium]